MALSVITNTAGKRLMAAGYTETELKELDAVLQAAGCRIVSEDYDSFFGED